MLARHCHHRLAAGAIVVAAVVVRVIPASTDTLDSEARGRPAPSRSRHRRIVRIRPTLGGA
jgi:hypothetical protein